MKTARCRQLHSKSDEAIEVELKRRWEVDEAVDYPDNRKVAIRRTELETIEGVQIKGQSASDIVTFVTADLITVQGPADNSPKAYPRKRSN